MKPPVGPVRVLELRSVRGTGGGPEKTILLSARDADRQQVATTVCYIRDERDDIFAVDRRAASMGIDYVEIRERQSFDFGAWSKVRRLVRDRRVDIVHAHEYKTDLLAWWLALVEGVIPLSTVHGWSGETWRELFLYYPADRLVLTRFPKVIAVSSEIRGRLIRAGVPSERIATVLNAIDHRLFQRDRLREASHRHALGFDAGDVVIGTVGRLEPGKGLEMLLDAVAAVRTTHTGVRLAIVGDGSLRSALEERAHSLFPDGVCVFLGHQADVIATHHAFDLFVHPSDHEGTPNAVLEAMALETPTVATDAGGTSELMHDGVHGLIVPCRDRAALAEAMVKALIDRPAALARAAAARRRVEQTLSFESRMHTMQQIYHQLAAGRRQPTTRPLQVA
jgi:glycosyltransferase involved in cell wall biosynthesis